MTFFNSHAPAARSIAAAALPLSGDANDYDALLEQVGDARFVLLGEASHGTHEFYLERARITQRLIEERGFHAVAVEADWPDAWRVNRFVRGQGEDSDANRALIGFKRFPTWMWRNTDVLQFVEWLRARNDGHADAGKAGFYGLDLYSLFTSIAEVLDYLGKTDPEAARMARERYACFDHCAEDSQRYGYVAGFDISASCEAGVIEQLRVMQERTANFTRHGGAEADDELFYAQQNARLVKNAEHYYRSMFGGRVSSWNLRDRHMAETLDALSEHLTRRYGEPARIVVWEHNSHIGDARATEMGEQGEWTVGQLAREKYGDDAFLVGFTTYAGSVTAASDWDAEAELKRVRPALDGSYEALLHQAGIERFLLPLKQHDAASQVLEKARLERAIGVIYRPETERQSHYFYARLPQQFDAIVHIDETRAVEPLDRGPTWLTGEVPETYPGGL